MKIGIDLDDTICRTTEKVGDIVEVYSKKNKLDPLDVFNNEKLKYEFFNECLYDIYSNVSVKHDVSSVIKRLKNKGNEIYIITARSNNYGPSVKDVRKLTKEWLEKHNIVFNDIIISAYGETKADICKKNKIDLMIDDDPFNYKKISSSGIKCLLFDDREKYDMKDDYVTSWLEIEKYIEKYVEKNR